MKRPKSTIDRVTSPTLTHCPYCALQCGMSLTVGERVTVEATDALCQKGWTAAELLSSPDRLTTPLLHGRPATWEQALDHVASRLGAVRSEHGPDGVAVFGGGGLTNEKAYQLGKFARVALGTSQIDYNGRFCMSSAAARLGQGLRRRQGDALSADRPGGGRRGAPGGRERGRDHAADRQAPHAARPDRHRPQAHRDRQAGRAAPAADAGDGPRARARPAARGDLRGGSRQRIHRASHVRF
ncbi:hypothetical protein GCM10020219_063920 [Nonomuraea dietziae]